MDSKPILRIENLHKSFDQVEVLKGVSFSVMPREVVVIVGPSGTGKSTLLQCINLLTTPTKGRIWLEDQEITASGCNDDKIRRRIGMVFQEFNLFNHLTSLNNVAVGMIKVLGMSKKMALEKARNELERVGMSDHIDKYPAQLSGGQKQRVGIARALGMDPHIILFDEPTSALDPELTGEVLEVMKNVAKAGMTMLVVSHEMSFVREVCDRVIFMENGYVIEDAPPNEFFTSQKNKRVRQFLSMLNQGEGGAA